ncbi:MAG: NAD-dependent epimerase/dehydratase family protein [Candidatus Pacebacteria bacterium]|nr:NAD-dependent epimerase/dehydratase family protein [Candidatus Paceibacterota bacterium]
MRKILITGGVGFIGTNCVQYFAQQGHQLVLVDDFSRVGVKQNAAYLRQHFPQLKLIKASVQQPAKYLTELKQAQVVIHLAGQTAVTTSIKNPQHDFNNNLMAGFKLLETVRKHNPKAVLLYASTNKVYGDLAHHQFKKDFSKEQYLNLTVPQGVTEQEQINLISPYGCSKGAVDFYWQDYARIYGLKTVVFRQSCIYGPFQMGVEDQGWVAHFSKQILKDQPITIFGDGFQVRDLLYVGDLIQAYDLAINKIAQVKGEVFNIGGGVKNSFSLLNVIELLQKQTKHSVKVDFASARAGDQLYFVSANQRIEKLLGWQPQTKFVQGLKQLVAWQKKHL